MSLYMNEIFANLYLGGVEAALDTSTLKMCGVTHILTIDDRPLCQETTNGFASKYIHGLDLPDTDLLTHMDECNQFIEEGRDHGAVLVHCLVGASRSATIVIAYTMSKRTIGLDEALGLVKKQRPVIKPNCGFQEQLKLYEDMGCCVDKKSSTFRLYKLSKLSARIQAGVHDGPLLEELMSNDTKGDVVFKCKKCRTALFNDGALLQHKTGQGESAFDWRSKVTGNEKADGEKNEICMKSLFIEPVKWMKHCTETMDGKLACPKCSAKIGSFIWYGERCPCGSWVAPAFHIQSSKVDECKRKLAVIAQGLTGARNECLPVMTEAGPSGTVLLMETEPT